MSGDIRDSTDAVAVLVLSGQLASSDEQAGAGIGQEVEDLTTTRW